MDVPADVFSVEIPDMYYRGLITKRDYAHKDSFEVKFLEDGSLYWLPIADCQHWLKQMEDRGRNENSQTIGAASDTFAASILAGFAGRLSIHSGPVSRASAKSSDSGSGQLARFGCRAGLLGWHQGMASILSATIQHMEALLRGSVSVCGELAHFHCTSQLYIWFLGYNGSQT